MLKYRKDFNYENRIVKQEYVNYEGEKYFVSTVDLGLDHSFGEGNPLYYETMIFQVEDDNQINFVDLYCDRYETREEALKEHNKIIELFNKNKMKLDNGYFEKVEEQ